MCFFGVLISPPLRFAVWERGGRVGNSDMASLFPRIFHKPKHKPSKAAFGQAWVQRVRNMLHQSTELSSASPTDSFIILARRPYGKHKEAEGRANVYGAISRIYLYVWDCCSS